MIIKFFQYTYTNKLLFSFLDDVLFHKLFKSLGVLFRRLTTHVSLPAKQCALEKPLEPFERRPFGEHVDDAEESYPRWRSRESQLIDSLFVSN